MFIPQNGLFIHALVSIHKPDAIRLWLCPDITAAEISLLGYSAARLDRDRHGSGIILFVADIYNVKVLQQGRSSWDLEFLLVSVQCAQFELSLAVLYDRLVHPQVILIICTVFSQVLTSVVLVNYNFN